MFRTLLEKQDKIIYEIFIALQNKNPCSVDELAYVLKKNPDTLLRSLSSWKSDPFNLSIGVDFFVAKGLIKGCYSQEQALLFFSTLLHRSSKFQLLEQVILHPYRSAAGIQQCLHISMTSFRRQLAQLQPLLTAYGLTLSFKHHPSLKGKESQIRWFIWQFFLIADPPFQVRPHSLFTRYQEITNLRQAQGFQLQQAWQPTAISFYLPRFKLDERGLLFLWRQLLSLEFYRVPDDIHALLYYALSEHTCLSPYALQQLLPKFHRIHTCCALFQGPIHLTATVPMTNEVHQLTRSLCQLLPEYPELLQSHPELPAVYQQFITAYATQTDLFSVAEE